MGYRRVLLIGLFSTGLLVICAGTAAWFAQTRPRFDPHGSFIQSMLLLMAAGGGILALLALLQVSLKAVVRWAVRREHWMLVRIIHCCSPAVTKAALGTALGTSIVLAPAALAAPAAGTAPSAAASQGIGGPTQQKPDAGTTQHGTASEQLPSPGWSAQVINIPLPRVMGTPPPQRTVERTDPEVVVAAGQSLWSIAGARLGKQATVAQIAAYWPQIYEANKKRIGEDPDQLRLGTVLRLPEPRA